MSYKFSKKVESWFADTIGKIFEKSADDKYDSKYFVEQFMKSKWGEEILLEKRIREYEFAGYTYEKAKEVIKFKGGETYDKYVLWMYGYLVKYWITTRKIKPSEVINILPIDKFNFKFGKYHTQGWEYIINDAMQSVSK